MVLLAFLLGGATYTYGITFNFYDGEAKAYALPHYYFWNLFLVIFGNIPCNVFINSRHFSLICA